jgi:hypothetical protein
MTHQLLLHLHRSAGLIEPRTIGVAKRMPTDPLWQTNDVGDPAKLALLEALLVIRLPSLWVGEYALAKQN